jgi:hypothetical protein
MRKDNKDLILLGLIEISTDKKLKLQWGEPAA